MGRPRSDCLALDTARCLALAPPNHTIPMAYHSIPYQWHTTIPPTSPYHTALHPPPYQGEPPRICHQTLSSAVPFSSTREISFCRADEFRSTKLRIGRHPLYPKSIGLDFFSAWRICVPLVLFLHRLQNNR